MKYKIFVVILALVIFITTAPGVFAADEITELQTKINERKTYIQELQKQIDSMKKALESKQLEKASLNNQLSIINGRLDKAKTELKETQTQLEATELALRETELKIAQKEQEISRQQEDIGELVRTLDFAERQTFVTIFASGKTLSDFFSAQDAVRAVDTELTRALIKVMVAKQELNKEKDELNRIQDELEANKNTLIARQDQLKSQSESKAQLLLQTKQSEQKFQQLVTDLKKQYSATEGEIASIERKMREKLNSNKKLPVGPVSMAWPVPSRIVTAQFRDPDYPFRHVFEHSAIDIRASQGTPIRAAADGVIGRAKNAGMGYSYIIIIHNNQISTLYGHVSRILVSEDQFVSKGDIIGYSGGTPGTPGAGPFVTGPHLHFEVRSEGIPVNPMSYLP